MAKLSDMLIYLRKRNGLSQQELANEVGMTRSAIGMYETGKREPDLETLEVFADYYNVDMNTLTGTSGAILQDTAKHAVYNQEFNTLTEEQKSRALAYAQSLPKNMIPIGTMEQIPLIGRIACGTPILAEQNIEEYIDLPRHIQADFALGCKGDSMVGAGIQDGDMVYIKAQPEVENGQIAAVLVDGSEATLKRFYFDGKSIQLLAENSRFPPMVYVGEEMNRVRVVGRAVAYTHAIGE